MKIVGVTLAIAMIALTAQAMIINGTDEDVSMPPVSSDQTQTESKKVLPNFNFKDLPDVLRLQALVGGQEHLEFENIASKEGDISLSATFGTAMGIIEAGYDEKGLKTVLDVVDEALDVAGVDAFVSFDDARQLGNTLGLLSQIFSHPDTGKMSWDLFLKSEAGKLAAEIKKGIDNGTIAVKDGTISGSDLVKAIEKAIITPRIENTLRKMIKDLNIPLQENLPKTPQN
ncbi:MAG: hypothetical protein J7J54_01905 [Candidatus Omnitrophica bacterium]|nr:hypothetical protein [Candidatus Omnitrophota bacterium]